MNEQKFRSEMRRAETMRTTSDDPMRAEYWVGYLRGLRRGHHGESFGTESEHRQWLRMANSADEMRKQRAQGYADGLQYAQVSSRIGRPRVGGQTLPAITVPDEIKRGLESRASTLGMSVADARRQAYRLWLRQFGVGSE